MLHITLDKNEIIIVNIKNTILKADEKNLLELTDEVVETVKETRVTPQRKRKRGRPRKTKVQPKSYYESDTDNADDGALEDPRGDDKDFLPNIPVFPNLLSQMYSADKEKDIKEVGAGTQTKCPYTYSSLTLYTSNRDVIDIHEIDNST